MHLTVAQGSKECHAVYLSCGNIKKALRTKISAHTWMLVAQIPIAKFEPSKHQTLFTIRALHQCLNIIVANLKKCAVTAVDMIDPNGCIRSVHTFLAAYIADLPEQQFFSRRQTRLRTELLRRTIIARESPSPQAASWGGDIIDYPADPG